MSSSDTATGFALPPLAVAFGVAFLAGVFFVTASVFFAGVAFLVGVFFVTAAVFFAGAGFGSRAPPFFAAFSAAFFSAAACALSSASSLPQINPPPDGFGGNTLRRLR